MSRKYLCVNKYNLWVTWLQIALVVVFLIKFVLALVINTTSGHSWVFVLVIPFLHLNILISTYSSFFCALNENFIIFSFFFWFGCRWNRIYVSLESQSFRLHFFRYILFYLDTIFVICFLHVGIIHKTLLVYYLSCWF